METKQTIDEWLRSATDGLCDDKAKAEVLMAHIKETAETERVRIKEREETERAKATDSDLNDMRTIVKVSVVAGIVLIAFAASCATCEVSDNHQKVELERVHGEHPGAFTAPSQQK